MEMTSSQEDVPVGHDKTQVGTEVRQGPPLGLPSRSGWWTGRE